MAAEAELEKYLLRRVKELGGDTRKVRWIGRNGAPDRLVMLPHKVFFLELKAPGKKPTAVQLKEHERLRRFGLDVFVADTIEQIEELLG